MDSAITTAERSLPDLRLKHALGKEGNRHIRRRCGQRLAGRRQIDNSRHEDSFDHQAAPLLHQTKRWAGASFKPLPLARRRMAPPIEAKPTSIIAHEAGSGTEPNGGGGAGIS